VVVCARCMSLCQSWMMNVYTTLFHFLVTQGVKTIMSELGCRNPDMHENLNVWWKKVGCALSFDFSMHAWVNCFICNHQTHWFWMFHESEGCHTSRGPTSEMIIHLTFSFTKFMWTCLNLQMSIKWGLLEGFGGDWDSHLGMLFLTHPLKEK